MLSRNSRYAETFDRDRYTAKLERDLAELPALWRSIELRTGETSFSLLILELW